MNKVITTIAVAALLSVSTNSHALFGKSNDNDSYALKVAKAGKINEGLRDVDEHELNKIFSDGEGTPIISGTLGVGYAAGVFDSPPIGGAGLASVTFLWDAFLRDHTKDSQYTQILAWMPQNMAKDKKEAATKMNDYLSAALLSASPENYELSEPGDPKEFWGWTKDSKKYIKISGPQCQEGDVCYVSFRSLNYLSGSMPKLKKSPDFLGKEKTWFWGDRMQKLRIVKSVDHKAQPIQEFNYSYFQKVSEKLPEWAFIYVAPDQYKPVPAIFNQGKMYLFSKPVQQAKAE